MHDQRFSSRIPLRPRTRFAHALFVTRESAFVNAHSHKYCNAKHAHAALPSSMLKACTFSSSRFFFCFLTHSLLPIVLYRNRFFFLSFFLSRTKKKSARGLLPPR